MKDFVKRMIREKEDLEGKIARADAALQRPPYGMDKENKRLLGEQVSHMKAYLAFLNKRIELNIKE